MASWARRLLAVLPLLIFLSAPVRAQTAAKATDRKTAALPPKYPDSADGLKLFLQDVLASAKVGSNPRQAAAFIDDMQIPDYEKWFPKAFGKNTGDAWSKSYGSALDFLNVQLQGLFIRLAEQNLEIATRKVTGAPQSDSEQRALQLFQQPVDVFFADLEPRPGTSGEPASAPDASTTPLGYFWFIDGEFRWDPTNPIGTFSMAVPSPKDSSLPSANSSASASDGGPALPGVVQPGQNGVGYPSCLECPAPVYTAAARAAKFEGTVELRAVIQPDGAASNIQVVKSAPYDLDANAVDTVKHWRFNPAVGPNGKPVAVNVPIGVTYALGAPISPNAQTGSSPQPRPVQSAASASPPPTPSQAQSAAPCSNAPPILKRGKQANLPPCPDPPPDASPSDASPPAAANSVPTPSPSSSDSLIERARAAAFEFSDKLPNFICEELMSRYTKRGHEGEVHQDIVSAQIIFEDGQETYRNVKINDRPTDTDLGEIAGSRSTGEFATILLNLFHPDTQTQFRSGGTSSIAGISAQVYDFEVRRENSRWTLHDGSQTLVAAYGGSVWVDPNTARVLRIEMQARNIPSDFPMDQVESSIDYSYVTIDGMSFLLPVHAESLGCERGASGCSHNVIDFRNYHEFKAEIKIGK